LTPDPDSFKLNFSIKGKTLCFEGLGLLFSSSSNRRSPCKRAKKDQRQKPGYDCGKRLILDRAMALKDESS